MTWRLLEAFLSTFGLSLNGQKALENLILKRYKAIQNDSIKAKRQINKNHI